MDSVAHIHCCGMKTYAWNRGFWRHLKSPKSESEVKAFKRELIEALGPGGAFKAPMARGFLLTLPLPKIITEDAEVLDALKRAKFKLVASNSESDVYMNAKGQ